MDVTRDHFAGLVFGGREDDLHLGPGQIGALHFLAVRRILRVREAGECGGGNENDEPFCGGGHVFLPVRAPRMIAEIDAGATAAK